MYQKEIFNVGIHVVIALIAIIVFEIKKLKLQNKTVKKIK